MRQEFSKAVKLAAWKRCHGICEGCTAFLYVGKYDYDHIKPAAFGGEATVDNCQVLCVACHGRKTGQHDVPAIAKSNRVRKRHLGIRKPSRFAGSRDGKFKRKISGEVVRR